MPTRQQRTAERPDAVRQSRGTSGKVADNPCVPARSQAVVGGGDEKNRVAGILPYLSFGKGVIPQP